MTLSTVEMFKHISPSESLIRLEGENLHTLQSALLSILTDINTVCKDNGVNYTVCGGTCLGAIRHEGFIPWDDDVDLFMLKSEFPKFAEAMEARFPGKFLVEVPAKTPNYNLALARVRLNGTIVRSKEDIGKPTEDCGVYVDIFYLENAPNNAILRKLHCALSMFCGLGYSCRRFKENAEDYLKLVKANHEVYKTFKKKAFLGKLFSFWSVEKWVSAWDKVNSLCKNENSKFICCPVGRKHYSGETYLRDTFFPTVEKKFENISVPVPKCYDVYLNKLYGNTYMQLPAEEDREVHVVYEFDLSNFVTKQDGDK